MSDSRLQEQVALISGAGSDSGIGLAIARRLGREGVRVLLTASSTRIHQRVAELQTEGIDARGLPADLTDEAQVQALVDWAQTQFGRIDILVNNAGMAMQGSPEPFAEVAGMDLASWNLSLARNLTTAFLLTRGVLPGMQARGYGRIVNIGSIHSLVASPYKSAYVAAKHGLIGFSKVVALETAGTDITINTLCPSYVKTPLVEKQIADQAHARGIPADAVVAQVMLKPMPKGVFIEYDELAGLAGYLLGHAARNITGQAIAIDGGWTAQ